MQPCLIVLYANFIKHEHPTEDNVVITIDEAQVPLLQHCRHESCNNRNTLDAVHQDSVAEE